MTHPHNTLLPRHLQDALRGATKSGSIDLINDAIQHAHEAVPHFFHNSKTIGNRRFHNEPRQIIPNAGFNVAYPLSNGSRA
jgi:hypothetical protein